MPENIVFTTNRGEIVELGDEYKDMGPLNLNFPTVLSQECITGDVDDITPHAEHIEPAYNYTVPADGHPMGSYAWQRLSKRMNTNLTTITVMTMKVANL